MMKSKARTELEAIRDTTLENLMATPGAQIWQEALADGEDPNAVARKVRSIMQAAAASARHKHLIDARDRMRAATRVPRIPTSRPTVDRIKQLVQGTFQANPKLGLAYREGKMQTDDDWQTLYDDLVALGAIAPDEHGR